MINIVDKSQCCGCSACEQKCPKSCIKMKEDNEGFLYPYVDKTKCVDCHLCEKVCPVLNQAQKRNPSQVYAAYNNNEEIQTKSSSGGVFSALANYVFEHDGVVFGAAFDHRWDVHHIWIESKDDLFRLQSSKYVQSRIGTAYKEAERFLKSGRLVLFSGTFCQISGLKRFLKKDYQNLISVDVICHGTPSPGVWRGYLDSLLCSRKFQGFFQSDNKSSISSISFREKLYGWRNYSIVIYGSTITDSSLNQKQDTKEKILFSELATKNVYLRGFMHNIILRPSCYQCSSRNGKSCSDITLGDFWGVLRRYPNFHNFNGVSLVLCYSDKGYQIINNLDLKRIDATYDDVLDCNINIEKDELPSRNRNEFFEDYNRNGISVLNKYCTELEPNKYISFTRKIFKKIQLLLQK